MTPALRTVVLGFIAVSLLARLLRAQSPVGCPNGSADDKSIRVDATVAVPLATLYQVGDSVLSAHGFQWTAATPVSARITAPRFTWPPGSESEPWHGTESPGLVITLSAFTAHDSTRLSVLSQVLCRVSTAEVEPTDSSVESQLRVLGAVEIVSGLSEALRHRAPATSQ
ncbi:MAG: hypothetical protein ABI742_11005 [Gemmatimonadota bacterium]